MLTNVMLYWLTGTAASSARLYYEDMHVFFWDEEPGTTPVGVATFSTDVAIRRYAELAHSIVHWSDFDRGGHFSATNYPICSRATCATSLAASDKGSTLLAGMEEL
jgi:hypothetical protein